MVGFQSYAGTHSPNLLEAGLGYRLNDIHTFSVAYKRLSLSKLIVETTTSTVPLTLNNLSESYFKLAYGYRASRNLSFGAGLTSAVSGITPTNFTEN